MKTIYQIIRIPKAGSTSLESALVKALGPKRAWKIPGPIGPDSQISVIEKIRALRKTHRRMYKSYKTIFTDSMWNTINREVVDGDVLSGHLSINDFFITGAEIRRITVLREPIAQFISEYRWLQAGYSKRGLLRSIYHSGRLHASGQSLDFYIDFLLDHAPLFNNPATRFITGDPGHHDPYTHLKTNFWHWGLLECIREFCADFEVKTGLPLIVPHLNRNAATKIPDVSDNQLERISQIISTDLSLYAQISGDIISSGATRN